MSLLRLRQTTLARTSPTPPPPPGGAHFSPATRPRKPRSPRSPSRAYCRYRTPPPSSIPYQQQNIFAPRVLSTAATTAAAAAANHNSTNTNNNNSNMSNSASHPTSTPPIAASTQPSPPSPAPNHNTSADASHTHPLNGQASQPGQEGDAAAVTGHYDGGSDGGASGSAAAAAAALPALPAPPATSSTSTTTLEVDGKAVVLDHLGPMVVGRDGTVSRIANWAELSEFERRNTLRILGKRNQVRLAALRGEGKGDGKEAEDKAA